MRKSKILVAAFAVLSLMLVGVCTSCSSDDDEAHPTNPVEGCADANPKTMLPNDT